MKYRIEDGEAKIPLSELNRLNDLFEENNARSDSLDERQISIEQKRIDIDKKLSDKAMVVIKQVPNKHDRHMFMAYDTFSVITIDEACEVLQKHREEMLKEDLSDANIKKNKSFGNMSVWEFLGWRKVYRSQ